MSPYQAVVLTVLKIFILLQERRVSIANYLGEDWIHLIKDRT
jgi:hypothetical protein